MERQGWLPKKMAKCQVPTCTSCLYGRAIRRPWRTKARLENQGGKLCTATEPGQCVSIDQLESSIPGQIAQMKGCLTKKRYRVATIFVDHFSGLSYIHLQKSTNAKETVEAKIAFECFASKRNVTIKSHQANNGQFPGNKSMEAVKEAGQTITFCGVNAHFQNAVVKGGSGPYKIKQGPCGIMHSTGGPRLLMPIYGVMPSGWPLRFTTQHLQWKERITSLP